jgi:hypothetical protein
MPPRSRMHDASIPTPNYLEKLEKMREETKQYENVDLLVLMKK